MANNDYILRSDALKAILGVSIYDTIEELEGARTIAENTWADGLYDAYKIIEEEVDAADVEPKRRWIPVTEKPPEAGVIVWDGDHTPFTADEIVSKEYDGETMYFVPKYIVNVPIIAWMSPPEPPEVES